MRKFVEVWEKYLDLLRAGEVKMADAHLKARCDEAKADAVKVFDAVREKRVVDSVEGLESFTAAELSDRLSGLDNMSYAAAAGHLRRHGFMYGNHKLRGVHFMGWKAPKKVAKPRATNEEAEEAAWDVYRKIVDLVGVSSRILPEFIVAQYDEAGEFLDQEILNRFMIDAGYTYKFDAWIPPREDA